MHKYFLLGMLQYFGPMSGYSLHKTIFKQVRPTVAQVYRMLKDLKEEGLVDVKRVDQERRPALNIFGVTRKGITRMNEWLREPIQLTAVAREPLLEKIWFGNLTTQTTVVAHLKAFEEQKKKEYAYYDGQSKKFVTELELNSSRDGSGLYTRLGFDYLLRRALAEINWAKEARQMIADATTAKVRPARKAAKGRRLPTSQVG